MGFTAAVAGASGYAGGELLRLLAGHPDVGLAVAAAGNSAGAPVTSVHPHLTAYAGRSFAATEVETLRGADVVFLALPHGESVRLAGDLLAAGCVVVDLGADHRLADPQQWEQWYGAPHADPDSLGSWPYGLPELPGARAALAGSKRVAVPGCYPTAVSLGLAPLLAAGLIEPADIVTVAASGTSGAGRSAKTALLASELMGDLSPYKVAAHQHTPEIEQALGAVAGTPVTLSFTTLLAPMPRGILATSTARLMPGVGTAELTAALHAAYDDEPFVFALDDGQWPHTASTYGSNACHIQAVADAHSGRAIVVSALDNLCKGAAGQAVQCANLLLGLDETAGLTAIGVAP
ncbi:MAG: N-acetyl-gamma-glutamyl-phosphate reductase [Frankiaceae bacterium]|nr:N-acetyl-gamma-glutamyl-phosphate reductase [Frankiaceae bacterium]